MKSIAMIIMPGCPYCAKARQAVGELREENPVYFDVPVDEIDETSATEQLKPYQGQYYYVPTLFVAGKKIYEAQPGHDYEVIKAAVAEAFAEAAK